MGLFWGSVPEAGVKPSGIIEPLNVFDNSPTGMVSGGEHGAVDQFILQRAEERFGHRVVPTHAGAPGRGSQIVPAEQDPEFARRVLGTAIGAKQNPV